MKHFFTLSFILLFSVTMSAKQVCGETITAGSHKATITYRTTGTNHYQIIFTSEDDFTGFNNGCGCFAHINGTEDAWLFCKDFVRDGKTLTVTFTSSATPDIYVGDFFVNYSDGEVKYSLPTGKDIDWTVTCEGAGPAPEEGEGGEGQGGEGEEEGEEEGEPNPEPQPVQPGSCAGHLTGTDAFYSNADPDHAIQSLTNGIDWTASTVADGSVKITMTFLDAIEGMAAPYLFVFNESGSLIGDPTAIANWDATTRTATHTLTGLTAGDDLVFLIQVACAGGKILFSERVLYVVGDDCSSSDDETSYPTCSGTSTGTDEYYTLNNPSASGSEVFTNGYQWTCKTMADNNVRIEVEFLDFFPGMAAPQLYLFHDVEGNEVLDGNPIAMNWLGTKAFYTLKDQPDEKEIRFLVQIAYEMHVIYTERLTYTVGQNCEEDDPTPGEDDDEAIDQVQATSSAVKRIVNGQLVLTVGEQTYSILGQQL